MTDARVRDIGPLTWVKGEIEQALIKAKEGVTLARDGEDQATQLQFAQTYLHQASGALSIIGLDGLTLFTGQIEKLLGQLGRGERTAEAGHYDLLLRALAATGNYLEELAHGTADQPLRLFPLYSELLGATDGRSASHAELFFPDTSLRPPRSSVRVLDLSDAQRQHAIRIQRGHYQAGLVKVLRGQQERIGVGEMFEAARKLEPLHDKPAANALWWAAQALFEALLSDDIKLVPPVKRICAGLEKELGREAHQQSSVPERLLREMLYFIAISPARSPLQQAVHATWQLDEQIPEDGSRISDVPLTPLLKSLRNEIGLAKRAWDDFSGGKMVALPVFDAHLQKLHTEALALGRPMLNRLLEGIFSFVQWLRRDPRVINADIALEVAAAQLLVESALREGAPDASFGVQVRDTLTRLASITRGEALPQAEVSATVTTARRSEEREALSQVAREIRTSLAHIEQRLDDFFRNPEKRAPLAELNGPIKQIEGALLLVDDADASALVQEIAAQIAAFANSQEEGDEITFKVLAHKLSALGFYIQALEYGPARLDDYLNPQAPAEVDANVPLGPTIALQDPAVSDERPTFDLDLGIPVTPAPTPAPAPEPPAVSEPVDAVEEAPVAAPPAPAPAEITAPAPVAAEAAPEAVAEEEDSPELDAELLEIFLEEAGDVLGTIAENLPQSRANPGDTETLTTIRRGFHTLKGSGRMVGLKAFGDAAWEVEHTLNHWLQLQLDPTPALHDFIDEAGDFLAAWAGAISSGDHRNRDFSALTSAGERLRDADSAAPESSAPAVQPSAAPATPVAEVPPASSEIPSIQADIEAARAADAGDSDLAFTSTNLESTILGFDLSTLEHDPVSASLEDTVLGADAFLDLDGELAPEPLAEEPATLQIADLPLDFGDSIDDEPPTLLSLPDSTPAADSLLADLPAEDALPFDTDSKPADFEEPVEEAAPSFADLLAEASVEQIDDTITAPETVAAEEELLSFEDDFDLESLATPDAEESTVPMEIAAVEEAAPAFADLLAETPVATPETVEAEEELTSFEEDFDLESLEALDAEEVASAVAAPADIAPEIAEIAPAEIAQDAAPAEVIPEVVPTEIAPEVTPTDAVPTEIGPEISEVAPTEAVLEEIVPEAAPAPTEIAPEEIVSLDPIDDLLVDEALAVAADALLVEDLPADTPALPEEAPTVAVEDIQVAPAAIIPDNAPVAPVVEEIAAAAVEPSIAEDAFVDIGLLATAFEQPPEIPVVAEADSDASLLESLDISRPLLELYLGEALQHVDRLRADLAEMRKPPHQVPNTALRAAHTLAGISGTTRIFSVHHLAKGLELALERSHETGRDLDETALEIVDTTILRLAAMREAIARGVLPDAATELEQQLEEIGKAPAFVPAPASSPIPPTAVAGTPPASASEPAFVASAPSDEIDDQLLPLFLEEGADLIAGIHTSLRIWNSDPDAPEPRQNLARLLHTLKGSARMTGIMSLGDVVHQLESQLEDGMQQGVAARDLIDALTAGIDRAQAMMDRVASGEAAIIETSPAQAVDDTPEQAPATAAVPIAEDLAAATPHADSNALIRVRANIIDRMVNEAGEIGIARTRIDGELRTLRRSLLDLTENVIRLRNQLREVEIQADMQLQSRTALSSSSGGDDEFDPLELDRYTRLQELTRLLAEGVGDVTTVQQNLLTNIDNAELALHSQARLSRDLQQSLMQIRLVPFDTLTDRLYRIVRQSSKELGKRVNLDIHNGHIEIDRSVLEHLNAALGHLLRNAITHGIESAEERRRNDKPDTGQITIALTYQGNEIAVSVSDDGQGLNFDKIEQRARERGLLSANEAIDAYRLTNMIFAAGFSTSESVSELSGRGVGMDVVKAEVATVGGRIDVVTNPGSGTTFRVFLPLTLAQTQAVLVEAAGSSYAIPSNLISQVLEIKAHTMHELLAKGGTEWNGEMYYYRYLPHLLGDTGAQPEINRFNWIILLQAGEQRMALHVDHLRGNQEIVVKQAGPHVLRVVGVSGATVLGDGEVVLILNPVALTTRSLGETELFLPTPQPADVLAAQEQKVPLIMVVDDSLTVRKITGRMLEREGFQVLTAKDGTDALEKLLDNLPDVILSDIEMPRMDGFDLVRNIRADERLQEIPIIMITSRLAEKHREHAARIGANHYLGKPYVEDELLGLIRSYTD